MDKRIRKSEIFALVIAFCSVFALVIVKNVQRSESGKALAENMTFFEYENENEDAVLVNINTADKNELMSLPRIGEVLADRIIEYRETVGKFETIDDIVNIKGISTATYIDIMYLITV